MDFVEVSTDILVTAIDIKGILKSMRGDHLRQRDPAAPRTSGGSLKQRLP